MGISTDVTREAAPSDEVHILYVLEIHIASFEKGELGEPDVTSPHTYPSLHSYISINPYIHVVRVMYS